MAKRIGVIRGGLSPYRDISIASGREVLRNLSPAYIGRDIFIDAEGTTHLDGMPIDLERIFGHVDVVWNALIGPFGSDGKIARFLEQHSVPFVGGGSYAAATTSHKGLLRKKLEAAGIRIPHGLLINSRELLSDIRAKAFAALSGKLLIKPVRETLSNGIVIVRSADDLPLVLPKMFETYPELIVEEYVSGKEIALSLVPDFRKQELYEGIPMELVRDPLYHSFQNKGDETIRHRVPGHLKDSERDSLSQLSRTVFEALGHPGIMRLDVLLHAGGHAYLIDVELHPPLTPQEPFRQSLEAAGANISELLTHLIARSVK